MTPAKHHLKLKSMSDQQDPRLGDRVDIHDIPANQIKHSGLSTTGGQSLNYPGIDPRTGHVPEIAPEPSPNAPADNAFVSPDSYLDSSWEPPQFATPPAPRAPQAPQTPQASPQHANAPIVAAAPSIPRYTESSVLSRVREKFGLKNIPDKEFEHAGFKWTFRYLDAQAISFVWLLLARFDRAMAPTMLINAVTCMSIAAIDDIPMHEHLGINTDGLTIPNPIYPPLPIRQICGRYLFDMFTEDTHAPLLSDLSSFYQANVHEEVVKRMEGPLVPEKQPSGSKTTTTISGSATS